MTVPGSNLLTTAFRLVCPEPIRIRKFLRRATNEIGYDVAFYSDPLNTTASVQACLLYTSPSPRDRTRSRMPSSA